MAINCQWFSRWLTQNYARRLESLTKQADPAQSWRQSEKLACAVYKRAAKRVPAYRKFLSQHQPNKVVNDIQTFIINVPITDKNSVFGSHDLADCCLDGQLPSNVATLFTSSGYSGVFSWGIETLQQQKDAPGRLDLILEMLIGVARHRTLLVNALPMGVRVPSRLAMIVDTGPRSDAVLAAVRTVGPHVEQILIVAEHPFLKKIVEEGVECGIDWPGRKVFLITGAEVMPENFRTYIGGLLGHDPNHPERGSIMVSLGVSELGLSLGQGTIDCRRLRQAAHRDSNLRQALFGEVPFVPTLVHFWPQQNYMETIPGEDGRPRLVVTTLDKHRAIPLIRYTTGDWASILHYDQVCTALRQTGHENLTPSVRLPILAVWGRGRSITVGNTAVFPEQIKESLYADGQIAQTTTGQFRLSATSNSLRVELQMKACREMSPEVVLLAQKSVRHWTGCDAQVVPIAYEKFNTASELSYQRKFQYL